MLCALLLIGATLMAYANTLHVPFLFDDEATILTNPTIWSLWPLSNVLSSPGGGVSTQGRPLVNLSLALNYAGHGFRVAGYHAVNLAIHCLNGLLLFGVVRRILETGNWKLGTDDQFPHPRVSQETASGRIRTSDFCGSLFKILRFRPSDGSRAEDRRGAPARILLPSSFLITLLWLLHPLCTQAVTYITQRAESLAALFSLLTIYALTRSADTDIGQASHNTRPAANHRRWSTAAVLACALGMATKETTITLPILAVLFDRAYLAGSWRQVWQRRRGWHVAIAATAAIRILLLLQPGMPRHADTGFFSEVHPIHYLLTQCQVIPHYLRLALWPTGLCFDYQWPLVTHLADAWPHVLLMLTLAAITLILWFRNPRLGFPAVAAFALLAPTSSIMPIADAAAEHRMYLPLAMLVVMGSWLCVALHRSIVRATTPQQPAPPAAKSHTAPAAAIRQPPMALLLPWLVLAITLGIATHLRNRTYQSAVALWADTVQVRPANARAWFNLGLAHLAANEIAPALSALNHAIALAPSYGGPYHSRAHVRRAMGDIDGAIEDYTTAIALLPTLIAPRFSRGETLTAAGKLEDASADFTACIAIRPDLPRFYERRADCFLRQGQLDLAIADFTKLLQIDPSSPEYASQLAAAIAQSPTHKTIGTPHP
jgi:Tfp pilus assembly protein PilF